MSYIHELTQTEAAYGVTLQAVARELKRGVFRGASFVVAIDASPALASSTARCAFAGRDVHYRGRTLLGHAYSVIAE